MRKISRRSVLAGLAAPALILPSRKLWMPDKRIHPAKFNIFNAAATDAYAAVHGSLGAPAGAPPFPHLLDVNSPSTQTYGSTYAVRPPWKVAGVDYNVGIDRSVYPTNASLKNPNALTVNSGSNPFESGVTYVAARGGKHNTIYINGNYIVFDGYDLSLGSGWVLCVMSGSNVTVSNCHATWPTAGGPGGQISIPASDPIQGVASTATNTIITKCYLDGTNNGSKIYGLIINGNGGAIITYCQIQNNAGQLISASNNTAGLDTWDLTMKYNVIRNAGLNFSTNGAHGDWIQLFGNAGPTRNTDFEFNLWLQDAPYPTSSTLGASLNSSAYCPYPQTGTSTFNYNTCITPGVGGGQNASVQAYTGWAVIQDMGVGRIEGNSSTQNNYCDYTGSRYSAPGYASAFAYVGIGYNGGETRGPGTATYGNNINLCDGKVIPKAGPG